MYVYACIYVYIYIYIQHEYTYIHTHNMNIYIHKSRFWIHDPLEASCGLFIDPTGGCVQPFV